MVLACLISISMVTSSVQSTRLGMQNRSVVSSLNTQHHHQTDSTSASTLWSVGASARVRLKDFILIIITNFKSREPLCSKDWRFQNSRIVLPNSRGSKTLNSKQPCRLGTEWSTHAPKGRFPWQACIAAQRHLPLEDYPHCWSEWSQDPLISTILHQARPSLGARGT